MLASAAVTASESSFRPAPDFLLLAGAIVALLGYLLPWFKERQSRHWWYSGWNYLTLESGGGWIWWTVVFLVIAIVASCWAGRSVEVAFFAAGAGMAAMFFASAAVAVSLGAMPERDSSNWVGELPFGIGLPLMAVGFGTIFAGALAATRR